MAKTQKFTEELLLDAVVRYAEVEKNKIKATELAFWSRNNIEGLEEVRDYHFTRHIREKDEKTGKIKERVKLCTQKIEEINKARSISMSVNANLLLRSANMDAFFNQSDAQKRKIVAETRETFDEIASKNAVLMRTNEALRAENKVIKRDLKVIEDKITYFEKRMNILNKQVKYLMKVIDERERREMLAQMGIKDEEIDLDKYIHSLRENLKDIMNINTSLKHYVSSQDSVEGEADFVDDLLSGIDF